MATTLPGVTDDHRSQTRRGGIARVIDRWLYVIMALWFIALVLISFVPDSLDKIAAVEAGARAPLPPVMHVHALLMGAFLILLLTQTTLAVTGRLRWHMQLGMLSVLLVPALVVVGANLAATIYHEAVMLHANALSPEAQAKLGAVVARKENIALSQLRMGILFPLFISIALVARQGDTGLHKRMMILATATVLPPAFARMTWLPTDFPHGFVMQDIYVLAAVTPMFAWDVLRTHRVHRAYIIWAAVTAPFAIALHALWDTPWWHAAARTLLDG